MMLLPLVQLTPLPVSIWSRLPMREKLLSGLQALNQPLMAEPLTIAPEVTWLSFLSLLPPAAIFLSALLSTIPERRILLYFVMSFAVINGFLGLLQISQGPESVFYLYEFGHGETDGLFANRNHFVALIYATVPFVAAMLGRSVNAFIKERSVKYTDPESLIQIAVFLLILFVLIVAGVMSRSRTGVVLLMISLLLSAFLFRGTGLTSVEGRVDSQKFQRIFFYVAGVATLFALQYGLFRIMKRFEADPMADDRLLLARLTLEGGWRSFPVGTGMGSFVNGYYLLEKPGDVRDYYFNSAHNEYLQLLLEGGAPALVLLVIFLLWFGARIKNIWGARAQDQPVEALILQRAASITVLLLGLHVLVDFALRTEALMCLFALCCAILLPALQDVVSQQEPQSAARRGHHSSRRSQRESVKSFT